MDKTLRIIDDPYKITAEQYHKFSKALLLKLNLGDNIEGFVEKMKSLVGYIHREEKTEAITEVNNLYSNFYYMLEKVDLDADSLKHLVNCDNEDEAYDWLIKNFTKEQLIKKSDSVKKNLIRNFS